MRTACSAKQALAKRPANPGARRPGFDAVVRNRPTRSIRSSVSSPAPGVVATASRGFPGLTRTLTLDRRSIVATLGGLPLGVQDSHLRGLLRQVRRALKGRRQTSRDARRARAEVIQAKQAHRSVGAIPDQGNNRLPAHHEVRSLLFGLVSRAAVLPPMRPLRWTSTRCAGPSSSDACSARAKQLSARDQSVLSEVVHSGCLTLDLRDARNRGAVEGEPIAAYRASASRRGDLVIGGSRAVPGWPARRDGRSASG